MRLAGLTEHKRIREHRLHSLQVSDLVTDQFELARHGLLNVRAVAAWQLKQGVDLLKGKTQALRTADEDQPPLRVRVVLSGAAIGTLRSRQQAHSVVVADGLNSYARSTGQLSNPHGSISGVTS